jgi:aminoglycoside phosphotransferase (APT) family kinase protein
VNVVATQLAARYAELDLDQFDIGRRPSCVMITPRFGASRHIVVLVLAQGDGRPVLVAKLPRLAGDGAALAAEATGLTDVQRALGETSSVPRLVAFLADQPHPLLVETAVQGTPVSPAALARDLEGNVEAAVAWLERLARTSGRPPSADEDDRRFRRLVEEPLQALGAGGHADLDLRDLVPRTLEALEPLRGARLPLVLEHGDTSHPNLLRRPFGDLGVVDWELADLDGLPGYDLCFFLVYAASASRRGGQSPEPRLKEAFFGADAWTWPWWRRYLASAGIDPALGGRLWLAACARAVTVQAGRTGGAPGAAGVRQFPLWRHAIDHLDELDHHGGNTR